MKVLIQDLVTGNLMQLNALKVKIFIIFATHHNGDMIEFDRSTGAIICTKHLSTISIEQKFVILLRGVCDTVSLSGEVYNNIISPTLIG